MSDLESLILNSCDLPTMPPIAGRVIQLVSDPNTSAEKLNKTILMDQSLAARVLKLANSSFYGCLRTVNTVSQAIVIIGFGTIKNIVLAASTKDVNKRFGLTEKMFHEHSIGVAMAANIIAEKTGFRKHEDAFITGLLHDLGKIVLNNGYPDNFTKIIEGVYNTGTAYSKLELKEFGFNHADVGALVIKKWNFPPEMVNAVKYHHCLSQLDRSDPYVLMLTAITNLADALCHKVGIGVRRPLPINLPSLNSTAILKLNGAKLEAIENNLIKIHEENMEEIP